ncbi:response regulator [Paenibacillus sp. VCA1]|uniref:response regulator n=1 Tax=Paenibacillus sp. VCA1 TaxID=3039148 RepID=UPI002872794E|nr:response regulator [Paenibacillus sp. VCA1]MDR9855833.1 response regulator [Paenibacillus sp. VCA1]
MKVLIVDDENLALLKLEKLLHSQGGLGFPIQVIGAYQNPYAALEAVGQEAPDVAFLDIEMPEFSGFELAEQLLEIHPQMHVVFVTAYQDFAVKAFEVNALDYLLKPVHPSRLAVTLDRIGRFSLLDSANAAEEQTGEAILCCLQSLHYRDREGRPQFFRWKTLKAPELFAYLIYNRDKMVSKQTLIDLLWPEQDMKKATTQLHTAIYQIRQMIKASGLQLQIKYHDEGYRLVWGQVALDVDIWENSLRAAPPVTPETLPRHLLTLDMYAGDYLEEHRYIWAAPEQERIRLLWLKYAKPVAECHVRLGQHAEAAKLYQQMIGRLPYLEDGYLGLMKMYAELHNSTEVRRLYQQLTDVFEGEYDMTPSEETTAWYQEWEQAVASGA